MYIRLYFQSNAQSRDSNWHGSIRLQIVLRTTNTILKKVFNILKKSTFMVLYLFLHMVKLYLDRHIAKHFRPGIYHWYSLLSNMVRLTSNTQIYPSQWIKCKWSTTNLMPICQDYYIFTVNFWFEKNCRLHLLYDTLSVLYDIFHRLAMQWYEVCNCVSLQIVYANLFVKTHKIDNTVYFSLY